MAREQQLVDLLNEALQLLERLVTSPGDVDAGNAVGEFNKRAGTALAPLGGPVAAVTALSTSPVAVRHWSSYSEGSDSPATHQIDIEDQRGVNGQAYLTVGAIEGNVDDMISVVAEVNTNPETGKDNVPCLHVSFDADAMAFSLFKIGDNILLRPESDVTLTRTEIAGQIMYMVE